MRAPGSDDGKVARFEALSMPHLDAAYNLARWLTGSDSEAEDLVQNAFLRAFVASDGYRGGNARAWLLTIVRNTFYTSLRDRRHEHGDVCFDEDLHSDVNDGPAGSAYAVGTDPARIAAIRNAGETVNMALARLPRPYREVLVMKEMDDLSYKEIAEIVGIPIGTVMSRLARARKQLLSLLVAERTGAGE
jgi:RNA polymerase sigma-70 factor (ECF subfamily)